MVKEQKKREKEKKEENKNESYQVSGWMMVNEHLFETLLWNCSTELCSKVLCHKLMSSMWERGQIENNWKIDRKLKNKGHVSETMAARAKKVYELILYRTLDKWVLISLYQLFSERYFKQ